MEEFLRKEQYLTSTSTPEQMVAETTALIKEKGWNANPRARFCVLYIIGKAKSLQKGQWLRRSIAAYPEPQIRVRDLSTTARAYTCFLKHLITEIPKSFQVLRVNDVASRLHWVNQQGMRSITELDCKEQFNKIQPGWIDSHMSEGIHFGIKRRRWRMKEVIWSIHHSVSALDRPGLGTSKQFRYLAHEELARYVSFELQQNNKRWTVGQLWGRDRCIPMGGYFSAQSADLHSISGAYKGRQEFWRLGDGALEKHVVPVLLVATDADPSDCTEVVALVKTVLETTWHLPVECSCADKHGNCQGLCLGPVVRCVGFCIFLGGGWGGLNHIQPAALKDDWTLRLGPSLMTPKHSYKGYLSGSFAGALANGRPWVRTWAGRILSALSAPVWLRVGGQHAGNASGAAQGLCRGTALHSGNNQSSVRSVVFVTNQEVFGS